MNKRGKTPCLHEMFILIVAHLTNKEMNYIYKILQVVISSVKKIKLWELPKDFKGRDAAILNRIEI